MSNILPKEGVLFTKDKKLKLEYECLTNYKERSFYFRVYKLQSWEGIKRNYDKNNDLASIMSEPDLLKYLYEEGYIDEKD